MELHEIGKLMVQIGNILTGISVDTTPQAVEPEPDPAPEQPTLPPPIVPPPLPPGFPGHALQRPEVPTHPDMPVPPGAAPVDSEGVTWDVRIHASTQTKKKDGTWKTKRGISPAEVLHIQGPANPGPASAPTDIQTFTAYASKIIAAGKGGWPDIQAFLASASVVNITDVPAERFPQLATSMKERFNVEF